jgi:hypothetical protein
MSASPVARSVTQNQAIPPASRRLVINSMTQLPIDYSSTPGGTLYSTTPGGTRIVYERSFLMQLKNSPMAKTPPKNISFIPGVTSSGGGGGGGLQLSPVKSTGLGGDNNNKNAANLLLLKPPSPPAGGVAIAQTTTTDHEQFEMDL